MPFGHWEVPRVSIAVTVCRPPSATWNATQPPTGHCAMKTVPHFTGDTDAPQLPDTPLPKLIAGARLMLTDSAVEWLALPNDLTAWSRLTRLLSLGKRRAPKGECYLKRSDLLDWGQGMILIALPPDPLEDPNPKTTRADLLALARTFPGQCFLGAAPVMMAVIRSA